MPPLPSRLAFALCLPLNNVFNLPHSTLRLHRRHWHRALSRASQPTSRSNTSRTFPHVQVPTTCRDGQSDPTAAYIHLPFCAQRCAYCAFTVVVSGQSALPKPDTPPALPSHTSYVDSLCREMDAFFALRRPASTTALRSLYLGGGTPSLLHPTLLARVVCALRAHVRFHDDIEITCEMDPATFTAAAAAAFAQAGVNRASIGAQSFNDGLLAACGRVHRRADIIAAVAAVRAAGISNVSLDLISALPGQTMDEWKRSLDEAVALEPQHISVYDLTLESGTRFAKQYASGVSPLPSEDVSAEMLTIAAHHLNANGFERYEVSNFARREQSEQVRSQHNLAYWRSDPFYAFGLGATSLVDDFRFARPRQLKSYESYVASLEKATESSDYSRVHDILYAGVPKLAMTERYEDFVINGMRLLTEGVWLRDVRRLFGEQLESRTIRALQKCRLWVDDGSLLLKLADDGSIANFRLSQKGALVENAIVSDLLLEAVWRRPLKQSSAEVGVE